MVFVNFCAEEKGLLGARAYAENPVVPLEATVANVNIEMVGRPDDIGPDRAWMTGFEYSDVGAIMAEAATSLDFEIYRHPQNSSRLFGSSDNAVLAAKGIPAHSISAGSLHQNYHQPSDEADLLDFTNMGKTVRAIFVGTYWLAERNDAPEWNPDTPVGRRGLEQQESNR